MIDTFLSRLPRPGSQDGFMLIEVMISAMLVALIAVATFNGFDVTQKVTADERSHNQATTLAQQDEERLRGMTASELEVLGTTIRTVTEGGTAYTITSSAQYVSVGANNEDKLTCTTEKGSADYIQTTSSVTWNALGKRKTVSQSANVRVPNSTSLMVSVLNRNNEAVSGAKVEVFDPSTASTAAATETTASSGCVIFGGLAEGNVKIVASNGEAIDHSGHKLPEKTVTITGTTLAEAKFTLETSGGILAEFKTNGLTQTASGFTFFALQNEIASSAPYYVGGTASTAAASAELTNLFPFVSPGKPWTPNKYTVYAGDCEKNNPVTASGGEIKEAPSVQVEPGKAQPVAIEAPEVKLTARDGSGAGEPGNLFTSTSAKIINSECKGAGAQNYTTVPYEHEDKIVSGSLATPYLPYAKQLELCAVDYPIVKSGKNYYVKNTATFANIKKAGTSVTFYLKSTSPTKYTESLTTLTC